MSTQAAERLRLRLFGPFEAMLGVREMSELRNHRKATQLIALLALHANQALGNEWVAAQLWPDTGSLDSLGHTVPVLRKALGSQGDRLVAKSGSLFLDTTDAEVDTLQFDVAREHRAKTLAPLPAAVDLYRGPLLQDWFDPWVEAPRRAYHEGYIEMLEVLVKAALAQSDISGARRCLRRLVAAGEPADALHTRLMEALVRTQRYPQAVRCYEEYRDRLRLDYALQPPQKMTELYARIPRISSAFVPEFAPDLKEAEPVGGATPLDSRYYIRRADDDLFHAAVARSDGIICVKGPRQVGKTSLLARGLEQARQSGARVAITDFQALEPAEKQAIECLYLALAHTLAEQLEIELPIEQVWSPLLSAGANLERYLRRHVLAPSDAPVIWAIDEADAIFDCDYRSSVFGLFRSWYNARVLNPQGAWARFTLLLAYSTEAHLLISNLNQSPFNVGTRFALKDFDRQQVEELNRRYGSPLNAETELPRLIELVGSQPFLLRLCFYEITTRGWTLAEIETEADQEQGLFGEHLDRLLMGITRDPSLVTAIRNLLHGEPAISHDCFLRLRSAGVLAGDAGEETHFRCRLYEDFFRKRLEGVYNR
jgi:DNA-binding SARP family transcriptional activator